MPIQLYNQYVIKLYWHFYIESVSPNYFYNKIKLLYTNHRLTSKILTSITCVQLYALKHYMIFAIY